MLNHFTFNGHSTSELGLLVSGINIYGSPSRIVEKVTIPYRSGDLIIDTGAYTNYMLTYTVDIMDNTKATAEAISKWLLGSKGYCELTDTYNPEIYRVASYYNQLDYTLSALYRYGKATITFDCKPQKYLTANQPVSLSSTLSEETSYSLSTPAMPLPLTLEGNTTQAGSSGKNKLGLANGTYSSNGITVVVNNGVATVSGSTGSSNVSVIDIPIATLSSSLGTVTKSLNPTGTYTGLQTSVRNSSGSSVGLWTTNASNATASLSGDGTYFRIQVNTDTTINCTIKPQIEVGSTATAYEPCLSPLTPQEIHSVKGDNEVRVVGFNIWNEVWENGTLRNPDGTPVANPNTIRSSFIPVMPNTEYSWCFSKIPYGQSLGQLRVHYFTKEKAWIDTLSMVTTFTTPANCYYIRFNTGTSFGGSYPSATMGYICINVSDTEKNGTYEPYKAQVYPINLPVENLTNASDIIAPPNVNSSNTRIGGDYSLTAGTYTLSWTISNTVTGTRNRPLYTVVGGSSVYCPTDSYTKGRHSWTFTLDTDANVVMYWWYHTLSAECTISEFMLEKGTSTTYFPYGSPSIELNALGNYKDYFHKTNGKWYLHKAVQKYILNGSSNIRKNDSDTSNYLYYANDGVPQTTTADLSSMKCNRLVNKVQLEGINSGNAITNVGTAIRVGSTDAIIYFNVGYYLGSNSNTRDGVLNWLASNPLEYVYQLGTPTETEITNSTLISQLNAISKAKTYDGSTTIVQEGTDAGFKLSMPVPTEISSEYFGEPIITVNEVGTIVWNDSLIKVNSAPVTINSQTLQCYYYSENKNNDVEINEFPKYEQDENYIGSTMALTVVPNYWKL